jgi:formylglycine-generating enzyme required for sulfatase activity
VNSFPKGGSPFRVVNMVGNAAEWVDEKAVPSPQAVQSFANVLKPAPTNQEPWYVTKGGSFAKPLSAGMLQNFEGAPKRYTAADVGFRCIRNIQ